jgi:hypothetical protein
VIYLKALFLNGGEPFFILSKSIIIFLSFYCSMLKLDSSTSYNKAPKNPISSGFIDGNYPLGVPGISNGFPCIDSGIL